LDIIVSGLSAEIDIVNQDIESDEQDSIKEHRELLEIYGFLLQWVVAGLESRASEKPSTSTSAARGRKGKGKGKAGPNQSSDSTVQLKAALEVMCKALKLKLLRVFVTTSERDTFVSLFTRPVYLILENEQRVKNETIKMHVFKVLCITVKHHGHAFGRLISFLMLSCI
jgi:condensin complex subunit 1